MTDGRIREPVSEAPHTRANATLSSMARSAADAARSVSGGHDLTAPAAESSSLASNRAAASGGSSIAVVCSVSNSSNSVTAAAPSARGSSAVALVRQEDHPQGTRPLVECLPSGEKAATSVPNKSAYVFDPTGFAADARVEKLRAERHIKEASDKRQSSHSRCGQYDCASTPTERSVSVCGNTSQLSCDRYRCARGSRSTPEIKRATDCRCAAHVRDA